MTSGAAALAAVQTSTAGLLTGLADEHWSDSDARGASLLPNWSRGHVLTHIARNADAIARTVSGALQGERLARYPNGRAGRDADIEAGAGRPLVELIADVRDSSDRLDSVFKAAADVDGWELAADDRSVGDYLTARWREVEIHRIDLGGSYTADQWPSQFVGQQLPVLADTLGDRAPEAVRVEVTADGSLTADMPGSVWTAGSGTATTVRGPDWAVLAWLLGRPSAARGALGDAPELGTWL